MALVVFEILFFAFLKYRFPKAIFPLWGYFSSFLSGFSVYFFGIFFLFLLQIRKLNRPWSQLSKGQFSEALQGSLILEKKFEKFQIHRTAYRFQVANAQTWLGQHEQALAILESLKPEHMVAHLKANWIFCIEVNRLFLGKPVSEKIVSGLESQAHNPVYFATQYEFNLLNCVLAGLAGDKHKAEEYFRLADSLEEKVFKTGFTGLMRFISNGASPNLLLSLSGSYFKIRHFRQMGTSAQNLARWEHLLRNPPIANCYSVQLEKLGTP